MGRTRKPKATRRRNRKVLRLNVDHSVAARSNVSWKDPRIQAQQDREREDEMNTTSASATYHVDPELLKTMTAAEILALQDEG
jgi:hypothetical protein